MRMATLRRNRGHQSGITGIARLDRRTKRLTPRLSRGDIAFIDHVDLDQMAAEQIVAAGVFAVVNAAPSISGRYPNLGPQVIVNAGIPLIDEVGPEVFEQLRDGQAVRVDGEKVWLGDDVVASGKVQDAETVAAAMVRARDGLTVQLDAFAANATEFLRSEQELLLDGVGIPRVRTSIDGRPCLVVVRGYSYREDLAALGAYIREAKPVLIGVDAGADALVEAGYVPDLIVGDVAEVSDETLRAGAEVVVQAYPDGRAPGLKRAQDFNAESVTFPAAATSEDMALLLADECGASMIVTVGTHSSLIEFFDRGRSAMASSFLTRLRVSNKLVDAKAVQRLYRPTVSSRALVLLVVLTVLAMAGAVFAATAGQGLVQLLAEQWEAAVFALQRLIS
ncbi:putative cytokinetic ring protein SteA [Fodinicola acaciae]|uniref:putative cytokinetic ring protein SteA n=1 Tax=Fodinicola acaciae TaxID=2681555 RepID=UPI0013D68B06|nr:putative cytokinetic ring protein SteA [Fodinicola acaciae]